MTDRHAEVAETLRYYAERAVNEDDCNDIRAALRLWEGAPELVSRMRP